MHLGTAHTREQRLAARSTPAAGEERLSQQIRVMVTQGKLTCAQIQSIVNEVGFSELSIQLGVNAGEITASYNAIRTMVTTLSPSTVIPDLNIAG